MRRAVISSVMALALAAAPAGAFAAETETSDSMEEILASSEELIESAMQQIRTGHEGYLKITAGDPIRALISESLNDTDDMSWIEDAEIRLKEKANAGGGADLETTFFLNSAELYHLLFSFDAKEMTLYAVCPELQEKAMAIPLGELIPNVQEGELSQISPELLNALKDLMGEFVQFIGSIPPETLQQELMSYVMTIAGYLRTEEGTATVTAGTLSAQANTVSYKISSEDMQKLIPQLINMLSQSRLLEQIMKSTFVDSLIGLASQQGGADLGITGENLYSMIQSQLKNLAEMDYSDMVGFILTVGTSEEGIPARLSLTLEGSGITAEVFCLDIVTDGAEHAAELKIGEILAYAMELDDTDRASILLQGSAEQNLLNETLSLSLNGVQTPVFLIKDLDLAQLEQGKVDGTFTLYADEGNFTWDYSVAEDDGRLMDLYINNEFWLTTAMNLYESADVQMDAINTEDAFIVRDEESLSAYMRDANVVSLIEKLADAGVPQEYVDLLTSGEASTESSRENIEEKDAAS